MTDHPNAKLVRRGFEAFAAGDMETMTELLSPDVKWHSAGNSPISGTYTGLEETLGLFGRVVEETDGNINNEMHDLLASDDHAVALVKSTASRQGKTIESNSTFVFHISGGQVAECWVSAHDQAAVDEFWS